MIKFGNLFEHDTKCFVFLLLGKTVFFPCHCLDVAGKVCNCFLPVKDKDPHTLSNSCRGNCKTDYHCSYCLDRTDELW